MIETAPFVEAVKRVALVAERNTPVRLSFEQGVLILEAGSSDDAQAVERVDAQLEGDDISIAFNPTFLLDGLSAIDSPVAQLSFTTSTKPALLSGKPAVDAEADEAYKYLIMPVRLSRLSRADGRSPSDRAVIREPVRAHERPERVCPQVCVTRPGVGSDAGTKRALMPRRNLRNN